MEATAQRRSAPLDPPPQIARFRKTKKGRTRPSLFFEAAKSPLSVHTCSRTPVRVSFEAYMRVPRLSQRLWVFHSDVDLEIVEVFSLEALNHV